MAEPTRRQKGGKPSLPPDVVARLAADLRSIRTTLGLSTDDVAGRAGLTRSAIEQYERGRATPSLAAIHDLAKAYGVRASRLVASLDDAGKFVEKFA